MGLFIAGRREHPALDRFARRLEAALEACGESADITVRLLDAGDRETPPGEEGFILKNKNGRIDVLGQDVPGLCYGMDEIVRHVADGYGLSALRERTQAPCFLFRAIKFNLPWSCYRSNRSVTLHTKTIRDLAFWDAFLDMMAEHRFNVLTLWSVHPYPYMTRARSYPMACEMTDE